MIDLILRLLLVVGIIGVVCYIYAALRDIFKGDL